MEKEIKEYKTSLAFRTALDVRLNSISKNENVSLERLRKQVSFDRLLARIFGKTDENYGSWILKGGYSLGLRFDRKARFTGDIDLCVRGINNPTAESIHDILFKLAWKNIPDYFEFTIGTMTANLEQAVYAGWRYPVNAQCGGRTFTKFHIDVVIGDAIVSNPDVQKGADMLKFAGIKPIEVPVYPKDQQFAEKLHSYSFPRDLRIPSRTEDLVDMVLLIESGMPDRKRVMDAVSATFKTRKTHEIPISLLDPPEDWENTYKEMAMDCGVECKNISEAFKLVSSYWEGLLKK